MYPSAMKLGLSQIVRYLPSVYTADEIDKWNQVILVFVEVQHHPW